MYTSFERIPIILDFWFGKNSDYISFDPQQSSLWFGKDPKIDQYISTGFGAEVEAALDGRLDDWSSDNQGLIALIILLDQFPRNIYRDSARAYSGDNKALKLTLNAIREQTDLHLPPLQRVFLYMPLQHAENIKVQILSVEKFSAITNTVDTQYQEAYKDFVEFALRHKQIIHRFGRFPHRNRHLQRRSTDEESLFLQQPRSSF